METQNQLTIPVKSNLKLRIGLFIGGGVLVLIGLAFSGFKGAFLGKSEGLLYMGIYVLQGLMVAGIGLFIKPGQIQLDEEGIKVNTSKAKFQISWSSLQQIRQEGELLKFWDDKGLKILPTKNLETDDLENLMRNLERHEKSLSAGNQDFFDFTDEKEF